jgi:hypothetical protein
MLSLPLWSGKSRQLWREMVSLAIVFACTDGAVLAADTQWTGAIKRHRSKVWWFPSRDKIIGLAGAGDGIPLRRARDEIARRIQPDMSELGIVQQADSVATEFWYKVLQQDKDACLELLLVICTTEGITIYENQNDKMFARLDTAAACAGRGGQSIGRYLVERLYPEPLQMAVARNVASYVLQQAKKYDPDESVGGATTILTIPTDTSLEPSELAAPIIAQLEEQLERIDAATRTALARAPGIVGVDINELTKARRDETMDTYTSAVSTTYVELSGVAALGVVGTFPSAKGAFVSATKRRR